jgi:hypothetical protein
MGALVTFGFGILLTTLITLISINAIGEAQGGTLGIAQSVAALAQKGWSHFSCAVFRVQIEYWCCWACVYCFGWFNACRNFPDGAPRNAQERLSSMATKLTTV